MKLNEFEKKNLSLSILTSDNMFKNHCYASFSGQFPLECLMFATKIEKWGNQTKIIINSKKMVTFKCLI
jgi:hypothetical protein